MLQLTKTGHASGFRMTKRLLGKILVEGEFITSAELDAAIERQKNSNEQLGEILVGMGVLTSVELKAVLAVQRELSSLDEALSAGAGVRHLLGELLFKAGRLSQEQLDYALKEQRRTGEKLGEVLVRHGLLMENELYAVLKFQQQQRGEVPASKALRLGEILVATEQITREQLEDILRRQKISKKKIGELLVEAGYVAPHQVEQVLQLQQKLLTAALVAALSMSNFFGAREAYSGTRGPDATIGVSARVLEHTSMNVISQIQELLVTNADIRRGYVELPVATRLDVNSNNPAGYLLAFEVMSDLSPVVRAVNVIVGGREVQLSLTGGWVPQPYVRGGATVEVSYRFILSQNAQPGTYVWPLLISVLPI